MLDQVRQAVLVRLLVPRAGADPDAERRGGDLRHAFGGDHQAVGEGGDVDPLLADEMLVHAAAPLTARARSRMKRSTAA